MLMLQCQYSHCFLYMLLSASLPFQPDKVCDFLHQNYRIIAFRSGLEGGEAKNMLKISHNDKLYYIFPSLSL